MSLILMQYKKYFVWHPIPEKEAPQYESVYFDRQKREFMRMHKDDIPSSSNFVRIPVLYATEVYRKYIRMIGYGEFIDKNKNMHESQFCIAAEEFARQNGFIEEMLDYWWVHLCDHIYDWAVENHIENFKLDIKPFNVNLIAELSAEEEARVRLKFRKKQIQKEMEDEEQYKRQRNCS